MLRTRPIVWLAVLFLWAAPHRAGAQVCEIAPFAGYRFGGDLFELHLGRSLDTDGAPSLGVMVDLFVDRAASVSFLYARQQTKADTLSPAEPGLAATTLLVEHWHGGGTYELDGGAARPFLAGSIGLTRFGSAGASEIRFSAAGGGGVKLMASRHVGVRLDGRLYAVFVDGRLGRVACGGRACLVDVDLFVLWQAEFTAAVVVSF